MGCARLRRSGSSQCSPPHAARLHHRLVTATKPIRGGSNKSPHSKGEGHPAFPFFFSGCFLSCPCQFCSEQSATPLKVLRDQKSEPMACNWRAKTRNRQATTEARKLRTES